MERETPEDLALIAVVAKKYYLGRLPKSVIAEQLYLSRFKVARLLEVARNLGIVRFTIELNGDDNVNLANELKSALHLKHAVVLDDEEDEIELRRQLGMSVVEMLGEVAQAGQHVGISSTRSLMGLPRLTTPLAPVNFVQLNGSVSRPDAMDIIDGIRKLTLQAGGTANVFYAPLVASSDKMRQNYQAQADTRLAYSKFPLLAVAITGIGSWGLGTSVPYDNLPEEIRTEAKRLGAVAEVLGVPINAEGATVPSDARQRIVAPDAELLRQVPTTIGVAFNAKRAAAVRLVVKRGLVNSLVTHRALAQRLLALELGADTGDQP